MKTLAAANMLALHTNYFCFFSLNSVMNKFVKRLLEQTAHGRAGVQSMSGFLHADFIYIFF